MLNWNFSGGCSSAWPMWRTNLRVWLLSIRQSEITGKEDRDKQAQPSLSCLPGTCSHAFTEAGGAAGLDEGKAGEHIGMVGLALLAQNEQVSF